MIEVILKIRDGEGFVELRGRFPAEYTVLDALESLRSAVGAAAASGGLPVPRMPHYRHSCHHGSCGTCGALIDGLPSLMCLTKISALAVPRPRTPGGPDLDPALGPGGELVVTLEPLRRATVIAGIAARPVAALAGIPEDYSYLRPSDEAGREPLPDDSKRVRFEACIECGLCSSACPVAVPFLGPAALAAVNREREKNPAAAGRMLDLAAGPEGAAACERHLACSRVCPQAVYPGKHIQLLKNALAAKEGRKR